MKLLAVIPGLSLQLWQEHDAEEAFAVIEANREYLGRWVPWLQSIRSAEELRGFFRHDPAERKAGRSWQFAIRQDGAVIGGVGLVRRSPFHLELGVWIAAEHEGRGAAMWSCHEMLNFAFEHAFAEWVEICCAAGNKRTQALAERLGFVWEESLEPASRTGAGQEQTWVYRCYGPRLRLLLEDTANVRTAPRELAMISSYGHHPVRQEGQGSIQNA